MRIFNLLILSIFFIMPSVVKADIADMRFGYHEDKTRLVFDMSKRKYKISNENSNVIKIIIFNSDWLINKRVKPKAPITSYQSIKNNNNTVIYLESNNGIEVKDAFLIKSLAENPEKNKTHRLVIDIIKSNKSNQKYIKAEEKKVVKQSKKPKKQNYSRRINKIDKIIGFQEFVIKKIPSREIKNDVKPSHNNSKKSKKLIVVDPGHGGHDPGAIANNKVYEKNITLAIGRAIKSQLERNGKYKVILTRNSDKFVKLRDRFALARKKDADFFISIHADKLDNKSVRGASVYTLSERASDKETQKLAERANHSGVVAGIDLGHESHDVADILLDFAMRESMNQSKDFANQLVKGFNRNNLKVITNPHRYAGFAVLKAPDIPSVLIETGFLSNSRDVRLLQDKNHHINIAKSIEYSLDQFFRNN